MHETLTTLTVADRCDRCGAQAHARTAHGKSTLLWCAHHYREHSDALAPNLIAINSEVTSPA